MALILSIGVKLDKITIPPAKLQLSGLDPNVSVIVEGSLRL